MVTLSGRIAIDEDAAQMEVFRSALSQDTHILRQWTSCTQIYRQNRLLAGTELGHITPVVVLSRICRQRRSSR